LCSFVLLWVPLVVWIYKYSNFLLYSWCYPCFVCVWGGTYVTRYCGHFWPIVTLSSVFDQGKRKQRCPNLRGWQITPQSPVLTEEA
jgi:hypothetical protein